jgi:hypothetical protein
MADGSAAQGDRLYRERLHPSLREALNDARAVEQKAIEAQLMVEGRIQESTDRAAVMARDAALRAQEVAASAANRGTHGIHVYDERAIYRGEMKAGVPDGYGMIEFDPVGSYRGEVSNGAQHGFGMEYKGAQESYEGQFQEGKRHGRGKLTTATFEYVGSFKDGELFGYGIMQMTLQNRTYDIHKGQFERGKANGPGIRYYGNGERHEGLFRDDMAHDLGVRFNGETMGDRGEWEEDRLRTPFHPLSRASTEPFAESKSKGKDFLNNIRGTMSLLYNNILRRARISGATAKD